MDQVKPPIFRFAHQGKISDLEGLWQQRAQMGLQCFLGCPEGWFVQFSAQRDVELKRVQHVGIAPLDQIVVLFGVSPAVRRRASSA